VGFQNVTNVIRNVQLALVLVKGNVSHVQKDITSWMETVLLIAVDSPQRQMVNAQEQLLVHQNVKLVQRIQTSV
jgi:hypothetical protein